MLRRVQNSQKEINVRVVTLLALLLTLNFSYAQKKTAVKRHVAKTTTHKKTASAKKKIPKKTVSILVPYRDKNLWGFADTLGNIKLQPVYKKLVHFQYYDGGKANFIFKADKNFVIINQDLKTVMAESVSAAYDSVSIHPYYPNHVHVHKDGKLGAYKNGKEIIRPIYRG